MLQLFFFFQAEAGIRVLTVTGVQTCALPIFGCATGAAALCTGPLLAAAFHRLSLVSIAANALGLLPGLAAIPVATLLVPFRSEERRVGKECRSRWSPYH